jgi:hypothetical protein
MPSAAQDYTVICGLSDSTDIFTHYLIKARISEKRYWNTVWNTVLNTVWNISNIKKDSARYDKKCTLVFVQSALTLFLSHFKENSIL